MKRSKPNQSLDENDSKAIQFAEQSIKALINEPIAHTMKASFPHACFAIHPNQNRNTVVFDEAKVLSTLEFQESDNKGIHVDEITERCWMHQIGFVDEKYNILPNSEKNQPIFFFFKKNNFDIKFFDLTFD